MKALPNITFTKWLTKLNQIDIDSPVTLIHVSFTKVSKLSGGLLRYDTRFTYSSGYYDLTGIEDVILLIFEDNRGMIFTTLRPYTLAKMDYYRSMQDHMFKVVVREPKPTQLSLRRLLGSI
jgi:hypothetical protein